jgi:AMMECR1 domain-containing protein
VLKTQTKIVPQQLDDGMESILVVPTVPVDNSMSLSEYFARLIGRAGMVTVRFLVMKEHQEMTPDTLQQKL